jgi:hypothetical protein
MVTMRGVVGGAAVHLVAVLLTTLAAWLAVKAVTPVFAPLMKGPVRATGLDPFFFAAQILVGAGIGAFLYRYSARRAGPAATHLGAMLVWLLLAAAVIAWFPGGSYLFLFPLLFALVGIGWSLPFVEDRPGLAAALTAAFAVPGLVIYAPTLREFQAALGLPGTWMIVPLAALATGLVTPLFGGQRSPGG